MVVGDGKRTKIIKMICCLKQEISRGISCFFFTLKQVKEDSHGPSGHQVLISEAGSEKLSARKSIVAYSPFQKMRCICNFNA